MDLRLLLAAPSEAERAAVDAFLGDATASHNGRAPAGTVQGRSMHGGHEAREQRHLLLPVLEHVQARIGWISEGALGYICERLTVPPADAYGVATFYGAAVDGPAAGAGAPRLRRRRVPLPGRRAVDRRARGTART